MLSFVVVIFVFDIVTSEILDRNAGFKLHPDTKYIIAWHSHPECAYNDELIPGFKNIAESWESYFYSYIKIKKILEQNKQIEVIFVEYTNNQITHEWDTWIWGDMAISNRFTKYSSFMGVQDHLLLIKNNPSGYLNSISYSDKTKFLEIVHSDYDYLDKIWGYLYLIRDQVWWSAGNSGKRVKVDKNIDNLSQSNLEYLSKIVELGKQYNTKIVFIRSPQHKDYYGYANEFQYRKILSERFSGVELLDFIDFPLLNSEFGDLQHVNYRWAKRFSIWFNDLVSEGLLEKKDKQKFIDEKIEQEKKK